ncbi:MAG: BrnA antitoxin family protein [Pseudomonadota bacterium]
MSISNRSVDPDEIPELDAAWFSKARLKVAGEPTARKPGRPASSEKEAVTIRFDKVVLAHFKAGGPGWQTRMNRALREAAGV